MTSAANGSFESKPPDFCIAANVRIVKIYRLLAIQEGGKGFVVVAGLGGHAFASLIASFRCNQFRSDRGAYPVKAQQQECFIVAEMIVNARDE